MLAARRLPLRSSSPMISTSPPPDTAALKFLKYVDSSPTPFHSVFEAAKRLEAAGFTRLSEREAWDSKRVKRKGKYFVTRNQTSLVAFAIGGKYKPGNGFSIVGTHTDSCCFKVRPISKREAQGYLQVGVETYGGGLWHTWLDRDLGLAGRVIVNTAKEGATPVFESQLIRIDKPILRIPTVAIHLDRTQNDAMKYNPETQMVPILALANKALNAPADFMSPNGGEKKAEVVVKDALTTHSQHQPLLLHHIASALPKAVEADQIHDFELCTFDTQPCSIGGATNEFLHGARFDNLFSTFCAVEGLIDSSADVDGLDGASTIRTIACWDNEEIGSVSAHGAESNLLESVLHRLVALDYEDAKTDLPAHSILHTAIANSLLLSSDMGHAVHPNFADKHEINHRPQMNGGPVVKTNAKQRYASTALTTFMLRRVASEAGVPLQEYEVRNDMPCGSTIGPLVSKVGLRTVDIGCAQLSMHSIRETAGAHDVGMLTRLLRTFHDRFEAFDTELVID